MPEPESERYERLYYAANARGQVVALVDHAGELVEQYRWSATCVPFLVPLGDVNADGVVDADDAKLIKDLSGSPTYQVRGDLNLDGVIDSADEALVTANHGRAGGRASTASIRFRDGLYDDDVFPGALSVGKVMGEDCAGGLTLLPGLEWWYIEEALEELHAGIDCLRSTGTLDECRQCCVNRWPLNPHNYVRQRLDCTRLCRRAWHGRAVQTKVLSVTLCARPIDGTYWWWKPFAGDGIVSHSYIEFCGHTIGWDGYPHYNHPLDTGRDGGRWAHRCYERPGRLSHGLLRGSLIPCRAATESEICECLKRFSSDLKYNDKLAYCWLTYNCHDWAHDVLRQCCVKSRHHYHHPIFPR